MASFQIRILFRLLEKRRKKYRYESRESRKNNRTNERHDLTKLIIMHRFFEKSEVTKGLNIHKLQKIGRDVSKPEMIQIRIHWTFDIYRLTIRVVQTIFWSGFR